jgi:hypothetical protein
MKTTLFMKTTMAYSVAIALFMAMAGCGYDHDHHDDDRARVDVRVDHPVEHHDDAVVVHTDDR